MPIGGLETDKLLGATQQQKAGQDAMLKTDQIPFDNVINADLYRVGPGDVLTFQKLDAMSIEEYLTITPENMVFLPRIGMININGKTLTQVRDTITQLQKQRTPNSLCYLALKKPRMVFATVRGNVISPGTYQVYASMRLSALIKYAMQPRSTSSDVVTSMASARAFGQRAGQDQFSQQNSNGFLPPYSMRNITIMHSNGTADYADLERGLYANELGQDPYIREGDEVIVPSDQTNIPTIGIQGGVSRPLITAFKRGDKLSMLLKLGGIMTPNANKNDIYLVQQGTRTKVECDDRMNLATQDIELQPGAVVVVGQDVLRPARQGSVRIIGEVQQPGVYTIENYTTRLKDAITNVGGLTSDAYLPLAYILRREASNTSLIENEQIERIKKLQYTNLILEDTTRFMIDQISRKPFVACDFVKAFVNNSDDDNVPLNDGDVIVVPRNPRSVFIYGQVNKAGYVQHLPGKTFDYYLQQAGGMTSNADKGRERVIKGRTGVWVKPEQTTIEAGDQIYVPQPPDEPVSTKLAYYGAIAGIVGGIAAILSTSAFLYNALKK